MKLLYVHERFGALAGAEANIQITASELKRRGHELAILHGPGTRQGEDRWRALFDHTFPLEPKRNLPIVQQALRAFVPDAVYVHKLDDLTVIRALVDSGFPLVRMVHDHDIYCMRSYRYFYFSRKICTRALSPYCLFPCGAFLTRNRRGGFPLQFVSYRAKQREVELNRRFDRMFVVTEYMREELLRNGFDPARIEIQPPVPRPGDPALRSSFSSRNLILYAGQIIRGKGVDVLLEALARVQSPFECVILGDGSQRPSCEALSRRLGLHGRVQFKGFVPQEELRSYYREASLVAISSVWPEPIATIGLEVMRYALPVVAFDAGGIKDWLHDGVNGFLVPWMDRAQFAERLDRLLQNKELARSMGQRGLEIVSEHYDFDRYIEGLERTFAQLARARTRPHTVPRQPFPAPPG